MLTHAEEARVRCDYPDTADHLIRAANDDPRLAVVMLATPEQRRRIRKERLAQEDQAIGKPDAQQN